MLKSQRNCESPREVHEYHWEIWQGGIAVAMGSDTDLGAAGREMVRYAVQYVQDGPITIKGSPELAPYRHYPDDKRPPPG